MNKKFYRLLTVFFGTILFLFILIKAKNEFGNKYYHYMDQAGVKSFDRSGCLGQLTIFVTSL